MYRNKSSPIKTFFTFSFSFFNSNRKRRILLLLLLDSREHSKLRPRMRTTTVVRRWRVFCRVEVGPIRNQRSQLGNMSIPWGGVNRGETARVYAFTSGRRSTPSILNCWWTGKEEEEEGCVSDRIKAPRNASAGPDPTNRTITDQKVIWCFI